MYCFGVLGVVAFASGYGANSVMALSKLPSTGVGDVASMRKEHVHAMLEGAVLCMADNGCNNFTVLCVVGDVVVKETLTNAKIDEPELCPLLFCMVEKGGDGKGHMHGWYRRFASQGLCASKAKGQANGQTNGQDIGQTNGQDKGQANGQTNGQDNGYSAGHNIKGTQSENSPTEDDYDESSWHADQQYQTKEAPFQLPYTENKYPENP